MVLVMFEILGANNYHFKDYNKNGKYNFEKTLGKCSQQKADSPHTHKHHSKNNLIYYNYGVYQKMKCMYC